MPIRYCKGNILLAKTEAQVNPVNCVGVMGKGLALEYKKKYPQMFQEYKLECALGQLRPGHLGVYVTHLEEPRYIINFPTKGDWRAPSKLEWISQGLAALREFILESEIESLALPKLGCGLGGLKWEDVDVEIQRHLQNLPIDVQVYL